MRKVQGVAALSLIPVLYATWLYQVNKIVFEPYLDEVFHARQAQAYCAGKLQTWDPKITTPPGLYVLSYLFLKPTSLIYGEEFCRLANLRGFNSLVAGFFLPAQVCHIFWHRRLRCGVPHEKDYYLHSVVNICLFPLLFFFSGLYYTDVCSISFVLAAYEYHIRSLGDDASAWKSRDAVKIFGFGLCALVMRQTSIFWVAVFPAGLHAVNHLKRTDATPSKVSLDRSGVSGVIYDPPVSEAYVEDYIRTAFSLVASALRHPASLLLSLWPYLALLALFAVFVLLNDGVVLGDKTNHVAGLHIPQMLYLWPYIVFFSWPILLPHIKQLLSPDGGSARAKLPRTMVTAPLVTMMGVAIHYNTIVHPFTLADNRHYVFYIFRILLRNPVVKYAAVPIYFICAWAAITALGNGCALTADGSGDINMRVSKTPSLLAEGTSQPIRTSFLLVYLSSTALSIMTAPLVEPRYFILPWLIWRLHSEPPPLSRLSPQMQRTKGLLSAIRRTDRSTFLYLETVWFLLVNLGTCWAFLHRGFAWTQEPMRLQRFMW